MVTDDTVRADRRNILKLSLIAGMVGALPTTGRVAAQENEPLLSARPMPTVDTRFPAEMAPGVFILPDKRIPLVPNIGIVVGTEKVLVVDCGLGIESAENVLALARRLAPGRGIILTVTHAHPEHGFGAQVFKDDGRIYYNAAQRDYFMRSGVALADGFRAGVLPPSQTHLLDGFELTPPHETYDEASTTIDLGGRKVELRTWGLAHSPSDQIVFLPNEGILFAGDMIEERMFPIVPFFPPMIGASDIDVARWEVALNDMIKLRPRLVVPGHGSLGGIEVPEAVLDYFKTVRELVALKDLPAGDLQARIRSQYPTWENSEFIVPALAYFGQA